MTTTMEEKQAASDEIKKGPKADSLEDRCCYFSDVLIERLTAK